MDWRFWKRKRRTLEPGDELTPEDIANMRVVLKARGWYMLEKSSAKKAREEAGRK